MKYRRNTKTPSPPPAPAGEAEEITGAVENIIYRSEESGYTVCSIRLPGQRDAVTIVGRCAAVWVGETLRAQGAWTLHKQHGHQFQADNIVCVVPTSAAGIERYLAGGMVRGIGKVMAKRLVARFGEDTLRIIEKESRRLEEVEGIGAKRRQMIKESWIEQKAVRDIMIFLQSHGMGAAQSARIYRQYGSQAIALISQNPFRLCADVWGIGFKTADSVASSLGIPPHSEMRARAGLVYVLQTMSDEGHCFCMAPQLILEAQALLDIPTEILNEALKKEIARGTLVKEDERIYPAALYQAEISVASKLLGIASTPSEHRPIDAAKAVPWAEKRAKIRFDPAQSEALRTALTNKVSIMTGGPGVGKTTIIRALVDVFRARRLTVCLAAPTGRAAKRMEEATGHEASTIHRLLKFMPQTGHFDHGPSNPLEGDVFILDEVSMIDLPLMHSFLGAVPERSSLILVGDTDQLPSVGPGNVLRDLIDSKIIPCRKLETIFRQEHGGLIVRNAHRVNRGEWLEKAPSGSDSDFYFLEALDPDDVVQRTLELVTRRIPHRFGFDSMTDIQVLTPMRKNQLGADNLNAVLQEALNPTGPHVSRFGRKYRLRDRVMQIRNNYDKDVFNGDIGQVAEIQSEEQRVLVDFDGRVVTYDLSELDELVHAYACSIHKAQGSEYPAVVLLMATQHFRLLQRNLLYTGLTRGRKLVCLVGSRKAVWIAIRNNRTELRRTGLRRRLNAAAENDNSAFVPENQLEGRLN